MAKNDFGQNSFLHLVRYGTPADQKYLLGDFLKTYDMTVMNANMVVHAPAAISTFLFQHTLKKPFIIDPQTFAFELDLKHIRSKSKGKSSGQIKKPFTKLAEQYGDLFEERLADGKPITPNAVRRKKRTIVKNVCNFQLNYLEEQTRDDDVEKYYDFVEEEDGLSFNKEPSYIIPPYFYLDNTRFEDWLDVNIELANEALAEFSDKKITPQIVLSKEVLAQKEKRDAIIERYSTLKSAHAFLIWIDDHKELELSSYELDRFTSFLEALGKSHPVINLFGGGFSVIAGRSGRIPNLVGVCHSIEYGEARSVAPVGGGIPVSKFYVPSAYVRFLYRDAVSILKEKGWLKSTGAYFRHVCSCRVCRTTIKSVPDSEFESFGKMVVKKKKTPDGQEISKQYPTGEAKDLCKRHYMYCKYKEYTDPKYQNLSSMVAALKQAAKDLSGDYAEDLAHLSHWATSLKDGS